MTDGHGSVPIKLYLNKEQARSAVQAVICGFPTLDNNGATFEPSNLFYLEATSWERASLGSENRRKQPDLCFMYGL